MQIVEKIDPLPVNLRAFRLPTQGFSAGSDLKTDSVAFLTRKPSLFLVGVSGMRNTYMVREIKKSLAQTHPEIAKEADGWDPTTIGFGSGKKVDWKCKFGHKWVASPNRRTSGNQGKCPICINKVILPGFNDLMTTHPDLAKDTTIETAKSVWAGSLKKINWTCSKGHSWSASPYSRSKNGNGCPICGNKKIVPGINDLATTNPQLATEADGWDPTTVTAGSAKKLNWKCIKGHTWKATPGSRSYYNSSCPFCARHRVARNETDLKTLFPEIAKEADGWDPSEVAPSSKKKYSWVCPKGHKYQMSVTNRTSLNQNCSVCAGKKAQSGFNDFAQKYPEIAGEAFGWDPTTVTWGSKQRKTWKCTHGHIWEATVNNRGNGSGCPVCANREVLRGSNDLLTTFPEIAKQAFDWDPATVLSGSSQRKKWICAEGHIWDSTVINRTFKKTGCPICLNQKLLSGFNDLATLHPEIAAQAHGWDPHEVLSGSSQKKNWICDKGHIWESKISSRISQNTECLVCGGKQVLAGFNDLRTLFPDLALQAVGWDPETYTQGSGAKVKWKCSQGHLWSAVISSRTSGNQGCPSCSVSGFDPNKKGWLYLLTHPVWELHQIGISNVLEERLKTHKKLGWEVIDLRGPLEGDVTYEWEQSIIRGLKKAGAVFDADSIAGKFTGYSESWRADSFPAKKIKDLMDFVEKFDETKI